MSSAAAMCLSAATARMRCSAALHGTRGDQPRPGRDGMKFLVGGLGHGGQIDKPLFAGERPLAGEMPAFQRQHRSGSSEFQQGAILRAAAPFVSRHTLVAIGQAERFDLDPDVVDFQYRGLRLRPPDKAAGAAAALDQPGLGKLRQRLVHSHARTVVLGRQFVLERNAVAGRPGAGQNPLADVGQDALMQRERLADLHIDCSDHAHAESAVITLRKRSAMASRLACLPPLTSFLPCTQTQSTLVALEKIQASSTASLVLPASEG